MDNVLRMLLQAKLISRCGGEAAAQNLGTVERSLENAR